MSQPWNARRGSQGQGDGMRQMFMADQLVFAEQGAQRGGQGAPGMGQPRRDGRGGGGPQGAFSGQDASQQQGGSYVGWGGQAIPEAAGFRVPW